MSLSQLVSLLGPEPQSWSLTKCRFARDAVLYALTEPHKVSGWLEIALAKARRKQSEKSEQERSEGANDFLRRSEGNKKRKISVDIQQAFGGLDKTVFLFPPKNQKLGDKAERSRERPHIVRDIYTIAEMVKQIRRMIENPFESNKPSANKAKSLVTLARTTARHRYSDHKRLSAAWNRLSSVAHIAAAFAELFPEERTEEISRETLTALRRNIPAFLSYTSHFQILLEKNLKFGGGPIVDSLLPIPDFRSVSYELSPIGRPFTQQEKNLLGTGRRRE